MHVSKELYLGDLLQERSISVSAPSRLDVGGTWDIKALALTHEWLHPCTTNIAISLRTEAKLLPYEFGRVKLSNNLWSEEFAIDEAILDGSLKLLAAVASHFGLHGYELKLSYQAPPFAGLGGSGTVGVAFVAALTAAKLYLQKKDIELDPELISRLAYSIEDGLSISLCGMQDHCAAAFGGISKWSWTYSDRYFFQREELDDQLLYEGLNKRLVVAYLGKGHNSNTINQKQMTSFWNVDTRKKWFEINQIAHDFYAALNGLDWERAAKLLSTENAIRISLVPERLNSNAYILLERAQWYKAGFAAAGAGDGGCVWIICAQQEDKFSLEKEITELLGKDALLPVYVERQGIRLESK